LFRIAPPQQDVALAISRSDQKLLPDGKLGFDGTGELIDAVVEMVRFDQANLLDRIAVADDLTPMLMTAVARMIVQYDRGTPVISGHHAWLSAPRRYHRPPNA
jgi:aminoglycoside phosphotransferase family enzyme